MQSGTLKRERDVREAYAAHSGELYGFALRSLGDSGLAEEAVQETFVRAWRAGDRFDPQIGSLRTWLFAITYRVVSRMRRDRARRGEGTKRYLAERSELVSDAARETESAEFLRYLLLKLSEPQRVALILSELEGFTSAEIAQTLGIPAGTVDSRLRAARSELSRVLERERSRQERVLR